MSYLNANILENMETIVSDITFDTVVHISDIHIRLSSRFDEYESVLQALLADLKQLKKAIVVITGDIFHHKNELTPDCVMFAVSFFRKITRLHPLVIIPGNHDFLMNNLEKNDSITSVLFRRNIKNVFYLKQSGVFRFGNIIFVHNSLWNPEKKPWIHASDVLKEHSSDRIVSLYHGMVGKCQTLSGYTFQTTETLSLSQFDGSDMVMLGDIHHHQFLAPHIAYAGSMISQNFNETDPHHGYLQWDMCTHDGSVKAQFHPLPNEFAYRRIDVVRTKEGTQFKYLDESYDTIQCVLENLPSKARLEIQIHHDDDDILDIRKRCQLHGYQPKIRYMYSDKQMSSHHLPIGDDVVLSQSSTSLHTMLDTYMDEMVRQKKCTLSESVLLKNELKESVDAFQKNPSDVNHHHNESSWKIHSLRFDHLFGYGKGNYIQFVQDGPPKVVGIFGSNSVGKSTLIDILMFMLYGRITRYSSGNSVPTELIHEKQDSFQATLRIQVGHDYYVIQKSGHRHKKTGKIKVTEELLKETKDGRSCLTEEHRLKTDRLLKDLVGPMEQFQYLSLCTQIPSKPFREMTQKERKEFLMTLFRLDSFEEYNVSLQMERKELEIDLRSTESLLESLVDDTDNMGHRLVLTNHHDWEKRILDVQQQCNVCESDNARLSLVHAQLTTQFEKETKNKSRQEFLSESIDAKQKRIREIEKMTRHLKIDVASSITDIPIDRVRHNLEDSRKRLYVLREESRQLYRNMKSLPQKSPDCEGFSMRRWKNLRKRSRMWMEEDRTTRHTNSRRTVLSESFSGPGHDNFSYFQKRAIEQSSNDLVALQEDASKEIEDTFARIDVFQVRVKQAQAQCEQLSTEHALHEHVHYNSGCEQCQSNPFRVRKETIEKRIKACEKEKGICIQKIQYESGKISAKIHDMFAPFVKYVKSPLQFTRTTEWTLGMFQQHMSFLSASLDQMRRDLDVFERKMKWLLEEKIDNIWEKDRTEYSQLSEFIQGLDTYVSLQWKNKVMEYRADSVTKEMKTLEDDIRMLEEQVSLQSQILERKQLLSERKSLEKDIRNGQEEIASLQMSSSSGTSEDVGECLARVQEQIKGGVRRQTILQANVEATKSRFILWKQHTEKISSLRQRLELRKKLAKITNRDGLPLFILRSIVPTFNSYINRILSHFIDRYVKFEIDSDGDVLFHTKSKDSEMDFHFYGGMESLMIDLATKITFSHFAYCPMPSFFVLDENISVLDEFHLQHIEILFGFLKQHFQHILLISHVSSMKNIVDSDMSIVKTDGYSSVQCTI